jgi:hypothetical protein
LALPGLKLLLRSVAAAAAPLLPAGDTAAGAGVVSRGRAASSLAK